MEIETYIFLGGAHCVLLAIFHVLFWKIFDWKKDLQKGSIATREIIQILNLRIIHLLLFTAFLCFYFTDELLSTPLGKATLIGTSLFWAGRTIEQFIFWKYNTLNINIILTVIFVFGAVTFALPVVL